MNAKQILLSLVVVAAVFSGMFYLSAPQDNTQTPAPFDEGQFVVLQLGGQPTAIQKPNGKPLAQPANPLPLDDTRFQPTKQTKPAEHDDSDDDADDSVVSQITGPFAIAAILLGVTLWAAYELGRKKREREQQSCKRNCGGCNK